MPDNVDLGVGRVREANHLINSHAKTNSCMRLASPFVLSGCTLRHCCSHLKCRCADVVDASGSMSAKAMLRAYSTGPCILVCSKTVDQ